MSITTNILQRTFRLRHNNQTGTCFTIDVDNRQYIVTARHLVETISDNGNLELLHDNVWKVLPVRVVGHGTGDIDISVVSADLRLSPTHPLPATTAGIILAQDAYFLGFPYGLANDAGELNRNFPLPLVKKGIVSAVGSRDDNTVILDGHNNFGFSGGPVVCHIADRNNELTVIGVVSGYRSDSMSVLHNGKETELTYQYNTGLVIVYKINLAIELINANPIGVELETE